MPKKILVADDERHLVRLLEMNLRRDGYEVIKAFDGEEALALAISEKPDLVILDITMPLMDGFQVLERLKASGAAAPVIIVTARSKDSDIFKGRELGADAYLTKPLHPSDLAAVVEKMLLSGDGEQDAS